MTLLPTSNICNSVSGVEEQQIYNKDRSRSRHPHPSVIAHLLLLIYYARGGKGILAIRATSITKLICEEKMVKSVF